MAVDAELLEILVCPNDRGDVTYLEAEQLIVCASCGYRYPVRDDIPVMLIDEAEKPASPKPAKRPAQKPPQKPTQRNRKSGSGR